MSSQAGDKVHFTRTGEFCVESLALTTVSEFDAKLNMQLIAEQVVKKFHHSFS